MASKNNITAVHFSLVLFVMTSIICGVMGYLNQTDLKEAQKAETDAREKFEKERRARLKLADDVLAVQKKLGHVYSNVGLDDDGSDADAPPTVIGESRRDLNRHGSGYAAKWVNPRTKDNNLQDVQLPDAEYSATIARLRAEIDNLAAQRNQVQANLNSKQLAYQAIAAAKQKLIDAAEQQRQAAEDAIQKLIAQSDEELKSKNREIEKLQKNINETRDLIEQEKAAMANEIKQSDQRIANLQKTNAELKKKISDSMDISFEYPDGAVQWIDRVGHLVWIDLGKADRLPERLKFYVYAKAAPGVLRAEKDLKGEIEVRKILGRHLAQARILDFDLYAPIAKGDFVYTPLWHPGRLEKFALAGLIDFERDGRSDRQKLHDLIAERGWSVLTEINDQGKRAGEPIDVETMFLVIGTDLVPAANATAEEKQIAQAMDRERKRLNDEAREHGVRIISLNDFLAYLDYKPHLQPSSRGGAGTATKKKSDAGGGFERFGRQRSSGRTVKTFRGRSGN